MVQLIITTQNYLSSYFKIFKATHLQINPYPAGIESDYPLPPV